MRLFNEAILRSPDLEGGSDDATFENDNLEPDVGGHDDGGADDGGGADSAEASEKPLSVREQLKKSIAEVNADNEKQQPKRKAKQASVAPVQQPTATQSPAIAAPDSLAKEAKADWEKTPPAVQQAFIKREQDMQRGVDELKNRYSLIDQALAPHQDALRQMNASPGEAVNRMFLWFKALAGNPREAFPGLAKSFGLDWNQVIAATTGQQPGQAQPQPGQQAQPDVIPEPVKNYVGQLEQRIQQLTNHLGQFDQRFGSIQQEMNQANLAKTSENLSIWSKDKEFFNDVRQDMARLVEANLIPLKNGQVDLDTVYERAIHFNPEVRAKVLAKQQQANTEVQQAQAAEATTQRQTQVAKARKASVSLPSGSAPGALNGGNATPARKPGQRLSVRDSLRNSIRELRENQ